MRECVMASCIPRAVKKSVCMLQLVTSFTTVAACCGWMPRTDQAQALQCEQIRALGMMVR
eukprot:m.240218 g.240218  ORF g.240218 m.240218 type:complete len:60 (-) comp15302_c2_seq1:3816-3995(-)